MQPSGAYGKYKTNKLKKRREKEGDRPG